MKKLMLSSVIMAVAPLSAHAAIIPVLVGKTTIGPNNTRYT